MPVNNNQLDVATHSCRRSGWLFYNAIGLSEASIKLMGFWSPSIYTSYIDNEVATPYKIATPKMMENI